MVATEAMMLLRTVREHAALIAEHAPECAACRQKSDAVLAVGSRSRRVSKMVHQPS